MFRSRKILEIARGLRAYGPLKRTRLSSKDLEQARQESAIEDRELARPRAGFAEATAGANPSPSRRRGTRSKDNGSAGEKLRDAASRLKQGPDVEAPTRLGGVRKFARRLALRGMRPFTSHQRQLDAAIIDALGALDAKLSEVDARLSEVVAGIELGTVPVRETLYLGRRFVYPYDSGIGESIARGNEWDAVLRTVASELLTAEEPTICEVGSNIGASLLQILAAKPHARVVAFEPSTRFRSFLERNLELTGFDRVDIFSMLVGREPSSTWLYESSLSATTISATYRPGHEPRGKELVEMTTLDEVFRDRGPVDFIKVDTDGFDFEVLRGAEATLKRDWPILYFELEPRCLIELAPEAPAEGLSWLQGVGYRRLVCLNRAGRLIGTTEDPEQAIAWANADYYCDVLVCPEGSASEARLEAIKFA